MATMAKIDLYKQYPEIVEELKLLLGKYIREGRSTPGIIQQNDSINFKWEQIDFLNEQEV